MIAGTTAQNTAPTDLHRTLIYSDSRVHKLFLVIGLALLAIGMLGVFIHSPHHKMYYPSWAMAIAGVIYALYCHFRIFNSQPLLTLSPKGLMLATVGKKVFVPWSEVRGIERVSFSSWTAITPVPSPVSFDDVTAATISRDFYEDEIVSAFPALLHHRVWSRTFRAKGDNLIQVCLHHDILPAKSEEIRKEVAARWYAFRDAGSATAATPTATAAGPAPLSASQSKRDKVRDKVKFLVRWGKKTS